MPEALATAPILTANGLLWNIIDNARAHLGAVIIQPIPSADDIIMDHVKAAYELLKAVKSVNECGVMK